MMRTLAASCFAIAVVLGTALTSHAEIEGDYLEARTCDVYTGPCFANGEIGLTGKDAVMAWSVYKGDHEGVDLSGLKVLMVVSASDTLGFKGLDDAKTLKSMIVVDERATGEQQQALIGFAKEKAGKAGASVQSIQAAPIEMVVDTFELNGTVKAGKIAEISVRKAGKGDCICSNETGYYPPLASVENFVPGVTTDGEVTARTLKTRWSIPSTRSAYLGTFRE